MKKIIAILLVMLSLSTIVFATEIDPKGMEDLTKYKIITGDPDGNLRLEDNITRAEAVTIVCRLAGFETNEYKNEFIDVTKDYWAAPYISTAFKNGIINGDENKKFNPEDYVTTDEIVKMFVCGLGYKPFADRNGGYPVGYYTAASRYGMFNNIISMVMGKPVTREQVIIMSYSVFDTPMMIPSAWNQEGATEYIIADGKNGAKLYTVRVRQEEILNSQI